MFLILGLMEYDHETCDPRRVFGKTFPVKVTPNMTYDQVLERSLQGRRKNERARGAVV